MAMNAVCSSSNPSPTLPAVSLSSLSSSKSSSLKIPHPHLYLPPHLSSSSKLNLDLEYPINDASLSSSIAALSVTDDALALARESLASAFEAAEQRRGLELEGRDRRNGCLVRRRKRRKRRKGIDQFESCDDEDKFSPLLAATSTATSKPGKYLTPQEEAQYSMYIREEARLESVRWKIIKSGEHEPTTKQWAKAAGIKSHNLEKTICNGKESQERIIRCYRRLVVSIASSYQGKGLSLQDLIQEGSIGLICGIKKFDPKKGYKMSTYIYYWIRQAMIKAVAEKSRIIRLPGNICSMLPKLAETNSILSRRLRRLPSHDELAEAADMDVATVRLISQRIRSPVSVDQPLANGGTLTLQDIIPGPKETTPEVMVKRQHMKQDLEKLLTTLCDREAVVLRLYYGLNGDTAQSYEEIGKLLKISRERVRQLRRIALSKLQHSSMVENLKVYLM